MLPHGQKYKSITFRTDTSNPPSSWTVCRRWCCCGSFGLTSGYRNQLFLCLHICIYTVQCSSLCISHVQEGEHRQISSDSALVTSWFLKFLLNFEEGWGDQAGQTNWGLKPQMLKCILKQLTSAVDAWSLALKQAKLHASNEDCGLWEVTKRCFRWECSWCSMVKSVRFWCSVCPLSQSGYIDGPILTTFHTNLVILPALMEFMQYGFIAMGLATIIIASLLHRRFRVKLLLSINTCFSLLLC